MKKKYRHIERNFEKTTAWVAVVLGNSITFIAAFCLVVFWLLYDRHWPANIVDFMRDVIQGVIFLTLLIILQLFNRFSAPMHLKVYVLVTTHEPTRKKAIVMGEQKVFEVGERSKSYNGTTIAAQNQKESKEDVEQTQFLS